MVITQLSWISIRETGIYGTFSQPSVKRRVSMVFTKALGTPSSCSISPPLIPHTPDRIDMFHMGCTSLTWAFALAANFAQIFEWHFPIQVSETGLRPTLMAPSTMVMASKDASW